MEALLTWNALGDRAHRLASQLGIKIPSNALPLYFQYRAELLGLSAPLSADIFDLLFNLSFSNWLYETGLIADPVLFAEQQFTIPANFSTQELALKNRPTCTEPLLRIRSYLPITLPDNLTIDECEEIIDRLNINRPDPDVQWLLTNGTFYIRKLEAYYHSLQLFPSQETASQETASQEVVLRRYLTYALTVLHRQPSVPISAPQFTYPLQEDDYMLWSETYSDWLVGQGSVLLLVLDTIRKYVNYSYEWWNRICRNGTLNQDTARLMGLLALLPTTPTEIRVSRFLRLPKAPLLDTVIEEQALMSTSLVSREHRVTRAGNENTTYFDLLVPAGTPVFCFLLFNPSEWELVFPPTTKYILEERVGTQIYRGRIIAA